MDSDEDETSISIINHNGGHLPDNDGTASMPQYHMFSGAIPKDTTDPSASHHALTLAYRDLKRKYDQLLEKLDHRQRHSPQRRRSKLGSDQTDRRTKSATLPMLPSQIPNGVSELTRSRSPVFNHTELQVANGGQAEILQPILKKQSEEIDRLKKEVADLRLTIAGREMRERSIGTPRGTTDDVVQKLIKQMQVMKKELQEQTYIIQRLLKRKATAPTYDSFERKSLSGLHLSSSRMTSVDSRTDNKAIVSIDEEDTCDYAVPNGRAEDDADIYGLPTSLRARDDNWDEPATLGATCGSLVTLEAPGGDMGATGDAVGNQHRRGPLPPRAPLNIEYNVGTGPTRNRDDNVELSVNFHTQATEQRQRAAVLNNDPLAGHKPLTSHRNIFHAEASGDKTATAQAQAEAAVLIECPVCAQQFDVPQNSPEFQHHVDECLQNAGSPEGAPRRCPVCSKEFAATVDQKDYEMHVNRHFDDEDISDRFQILDFAHPQNN